MMFAHGRVLLRFSRPYARQLTLFIVLGVLDQLLAVASAALGAWLVTSAILGTPLADLTGGLALLVGIVLPRASTGWLESTIAHDLAFCVLMDLRNRLFRAFDRLAPELLRGRRSGDLAARSLDDVEQLEVFYAHTLGPLVTALVVPVASLTTLFILSPWIALLTLPFVILLALTPTWQRRRAVREGTELRDQIGTLNAEAVDVVQGIREVVTFRAEQTFAHRIAERTRALRGIQHAIAARMGTEKALSDATVALATVSVLVAAGLLVANGQLDIGLLPTMVILAGAALAPVGKLADTARELGSVAAALGRVQIILDAPPLVTDTGIRELAAVTPLTLTLDAVGYAYEPDRAPAVDDVSITVRRGETVAVVGRSGAGKSTLAKLALRYFDPDTGAVLVGGTDIRELTLASLRRTVAAIPQDVFLVDGTIRDNIALGRPDATPDRVEDAARLARAHEFITDLPQGYDTRLGENATELSGGQRQRLAIARAILHDAPVLIMDEPASNLDAGNERLVHDALRAAGRDRICLVFTHQLVTLQSADRVIVLEEGRIVDEGTYRELIARGRPLTS